MIIRMNVERRRNDALAKKRGKNENSLDPGKSKKRITQTNKRLKRGRCTKVSRGRVN